MFMIKLFEVGTPNLSVDGQLLSVGAQIIENFWFFSPSLPSPSLINVSTPLLLLLHSFLTLVLGWGFQLALKTNALKGIFPAFSSRLGLMTQEDSCTQKLLPSWPHSLYCSSVSQSNMALLINIHSINIFFSGRESVLMQIVADKKEENPETSRMTMLCN